MTVASFDAPHIQGDGTWNRGETDHRPTYYDGFGRYLDVAGQGTSLAFDGFNYTTTRTQQVYDREILRTLGLQKVKLSYSQGFSSG